MNQSFSKGTYLFHKEPNFNYQMNRWATFGRIPVEDVMEAAQRISTIEDWRREFSALASRAREKGDTLQEAACWRAVDFFLPCSDPEKDAIYEKQKQLMREHYKEYFEQKRILECSVRYGNADLPVWRVPCWEGLKSKGTVLMTGGFDCYKEELVPVMIYFADKGFDFFIFEGPGQGEVLQCSGLPMTHEWEKPVKAVLDGLGLNDVTLIGLSLGGYLAPRAAIDEPRIKRVIAWGVMHDFYRVVSTRRGKGFGLFIDVMTSLRLAPLFNLIVRMKMKRDTYAFWGIDHGMRVTGTSSPYGYFRMLRKYSMEKIAGLIKQDFLLLAGAGDHFVEIKNFFVQAKALANVSSFTGRIFTKSESAENHCQFGNLELVLKTMVNWIELHS